MTELEPESGLHHMPAANVESTRRELEQVGWLVFVLPEAMIDGRGFFQGVRSTLPLDPPVLSDDNWNALSDSLWNGVDSLDVDRVALIWPESDTMAELAPEDFRVAQELLADIASSLADRDATAGEPTKFTVILT